MAEDKIIGGGTLSDFLAKLQERFDTNVVHPDNYMIGKDINSDPKNITNDQGQIVDRDTWDWSKGNPFEKMMQSPAEQGTVRGFLQRMQGNPTNVGSATEMTAPTPTPNDVNPTPMQQQRQAGLQSTTPTPTPRPDYSMPTALDPNQIEELRKSLLTESGQMDPNNPNGLSGRMNSPNSAVDQRAQMNQSQNMHDDLRGFDGSRNQRIKQSNQNGQLEAGNIDLNNRPNVRNPDGTTSTVRTIGISTDRGYVNIPTVSEDGRVMSNQEAIEQYKNTGKHLGIYRDQASADTAAKSLHHNQARRYGLE